MPATEARETTARREAAREAAAGRAAAREAGSRAAGPRRRRRRSRRPSPPAPVLPPPAPRPSRGAAARLGRAPTVVARRDGEAASRALRLADAALRRRSRRWVDSVSCLSHLLGGLITATTTSSNSPTPATAPSTTRSARTPPSRARQRTAGRRPRAARVAVEDTRAGADGDEGPRKGGPRVARAWVGDVRGDHCVRRTTQGRDGRRRIVAPAQHGARGATRRRRARHLPAHSPRVASKPRRRRP